METIKAIIKNGVVENLIVVDPNNHADISGAIVPDGVPVGIGWEYANGEFIAPVAVPPPPPAPPTELEILKRALLNKGVIAEQDLAAARRDR